ncbi:hypothetical protein [Lentibacillus amyloliquefaciens]|uniref:Uncharacterized protein n=1 Tax=Lentibacillus amyloliquefaciens TaxID=1472767 RepID=A0A0U4F732_9BACI|nr:hypothetical protein [Lentibacillus amyloliquefaciens]ALX48579.1 hypothetical protein AOX59_08120 [Lentibacillus amyloliquefaciens]
MKIASVFLAIVVAALITLYEWPRINEDQKKEKRAFIILTTGGFLLAVMLIIFPNLSGPTEFVQWVFKPFSQLLEG